MYQLKGDLMRCEPPPDGNDQRQQRGGVMTRAQPHVPDLDLLDQHGRTVSLRAWRGRPVVLIFLRWLG